MMLKYGDKWYEVCLKKRHSNKTKISHRKTPDYSHMALLEPAPILVMALCLPEENLDGKPFFKKVPISQTYIKGYRQDIDSADLLPKDFRGIHVDLWNQMTYNRDRGFGWCCNFEMKRPKYEINLEDYYE